MKSTIESKEFSIQFVSNMTGINPHTIRAWEKRYLAVVPSRDKAGRRYYSHDLIERLKLLNELILMGNKISELANLPDSDLSNLATKFSKRRKVSLLNRNSDTDTDTDADIQISSDDIYSLSTQENSKDITTSMQGLLLALKFYKLDIISHELDKIRGKLGLRDYAFNIIYPLLIEVGLQVSAGQLTIAQEHALSSILKFHIGHSLFSNLNKKELSPNTILITTPEYELHEFGILISALLCAHYKIKFYYLGPNLPVESLSDAIIQIKPNLTILSVTTPQEHFPTEHLQKYFKALSRSIPTDTKLWIGGPYNPIKSMPLSQFTYIPGLHTLDMELSQFHVSK